MRYLTVVPAYGRDYKSKAAALADWNANLDFEIRAYTASGYINREQQEADMTISIRYDNLSEVAVVPPPKATP